MTARSCQRATMRTLIFLVMLAAPLWKGVAFGQQLLPMEGAGGWGYVDRTGAWVIEPQFRQATRFSEGHALVLQHGNWHFIDETGANTMGHTFDSQGTSKFNHIEIAMPGASLFSGGLAATYINFSGHAVIRRDGEVAFESPGALQVGDAFTFRDGLGVAYSDRSLAGYFDDTGAWVILPTYQRARLFSEGLAAAQDSDSELWGYIDRSGSWVIEPQFEDAGDFASGRAPVSHRGLNRVGYIDRTGEFVISGEFRRVAPFSDGLAHVTDYEGSYYIGTDGRRALDGVLLAEFCHTEPFIDGLALVVIRTPEGCDYVSSSGDGLSFVQPLHGLLGYIDTTGEVVVRQSQSERDAMVAELRRAEQELLDAEMARLAACPDEVEYGVPGSGNYLVIHVNGKRRTLHLAATAVRVLTDRLFLTLPAFGRDDTSSAMGTSLTYALHPRDYEPSGYVVSAHGFGSSGPRLDCVTLTQDMLRQSSASLRPTTVVLPAGDRPGRVAGIIADPARADGEDGIEFHFDTSHFIGLDVTTLTRGWHAGAPVEHADIVHRPTYRTLAITLGDDDGTEYRLGGFDGDAGRYYVQHGSSLHVYDVAHSGDGVAIDVFQIDISDFVAEEEASFFSFGREQRLRERYAPEPAQRVLSVAASAYVTEPYLPALIFTPVAGAGPGVAVHDDRDPALQLAHALFGASFGGRGQTHITSDALPERVNPDITAPGAHELALRTGEAPVIVRETIAPAERGTLRITVEAHVETVEEVAAEEPSDETTTLCRDLIAEMERVSDQAADEEAMLEAMIPLLIAAGFADDPDAIRADKGEAAMEKFMDRCEHAMEMSLESIYEEIFGNYHEELAADLGVVLVVDAQTGLPLRRSSVSKDTHVDVEYRDAHVVITAENEAQGRHSARFDVPAGILDITQLHSVVAALPLRPGHAQELIFLATEVGTSQSYELMPDGSMRTDSRRFIEPRFVRVVVHVDGLAPATAEIAEAAYAVRVGFEPSGYDQWPLGLHTPIMAEGVPYFILHIGSESRALLAFEHAGGIAARLP